MERLSVIGGKGPFNATVQDDEPQLKVIASAPAPALAARMAARKSPASPAPVPADPPELLSVKIVTVKVAASDVRG
jgi:hypothetical protein